MDLDWNEKNWIDNPNPKSDFDFGLSIHNPIHQIGLKSGLSNPIQQYPDNNWYDFYIWNTFIRTATIVMACTSCNIFPTTTAAAATWVLPAGTFLRREGDCRMWGSLVGMEHQQAHLVHVASQLQQRVKQVSPRVHKLLPTSYYFLGE